MKFDFGVRRRDVIERSGEEAKTGGGEDIVVEIGLLHRVGSL